MLDNFHLHPRIREVSEEPFKLGLYPQAVFEAVKMIEIMVKEKSRTKNEYGQPLMEKVFSEEKPLLVISSNRDERRGFRDLFRGAMGGIKNEKSHSIVVQKNPFRALWYLAFLSLLATRVDEASVVGPTS